MISEVSPGPSVSSCPREWVAPSPSLRMTDVEGGTLISIAPPKAIPRPLFQVRIRSVEASSAVLAKRMTENDAKALAQEFNCRFATPECQAIAEKQPVPKSAKIDPVFFRSNYCCVYCGRDLLRDAETFTTAVKDHFQPKSAGGGDGLANRVASCVICDRLKGARKFRKLDAAKSAVKEQRRYMQKVYEEVCRLVRGGQREAVSP